MLTTLMTILIQSWKKYSCVNFGSILDDPLCEPEICSLLMRSPNIFSRSVKINISLTIIRKCTNSRYIESNIFLHISAHYMLPQQIHLKTVSFSFIFFLVCPFDCTNSFSLKDLRTYIEHFIDYLIS